MLKARTDITNVCNEARMQIGRHYEIIVLTKPLSTYVLLT